jgi:hypothetical protein
MRVIAIIFFLSIVGSFRLAYEVSGGKSYGLPLIVKLILAASPVVLVVSGIGLLVRSLF